MTSPAITKSPQNQKAEKKSPTHSTGGGTGPVQANVAVPTAGTANVAAPPPETFSWLRVFRLADLMVKQGC